MTEKPDPKKVAEDFLKLKNVEGEIIFASKFLKLITSDCWFSLLQFKR
jgi:hypothetical protein